MFCGEGYMSMQSQPLWTKNFTIITLGTVVSMLGNAISGFALGLIILDYTGSTLLYAISAVVTNLPKIIMPSLAGPYIDRFSRKKVIYTFDFISSFLFLVIFFVLHFKLANYVIMLLFAAIIGTIDSIYGVAYESLYPMLISKGNFQKAYSISSMIYPLAAFMTPIAAYVYNIVPNGEGLTYLILFNALSFLIAAIFETQIDIREMHAEATKSMGYGIQKYINDFKEGIKYLKNELGLLTITAYFTINSFTNSASGILLLPYFKSQDSLGVMTFTFVTGANLLGRLIGGLFHYKKVFPQDKKFTIAMFVYVTSNLIGCAYLFTPIFGMLALQFISGLICVTSFNIRISSTQNYLPDTVRGRFNGTFQMLTMLGTVLGQALGGALGDTGIPMRMIVVAFCVTDIIAAMLIMYRGREHVKKIYNVTI